ncbi:MAG: type II secretion system protein [Alphaproteobacteria bacterium]|nr:type II secretion system protein [Alphaproteobacteria bacterium]
MRNLASQRGFTLVEMAMVIVIIGLVMLTVFPALVATRTANQTALTQSNLRNLMLATAAYVQANGCLPCPADASLNGAKFGKISTAAACGSCSAIEGIFPYVSLGVPASVAHDGWGHWITMRVDPALTTIPISSTTVFVPPTAICSQTDANNGYCTSAQVGSASKGLCKSGLATTQRISVITPQGATQQAAVIFVSHGKDGYGSCFAEAAQNPNNGFRLPFPSNYAACSPAGGYGQCDAGGGSQNCNTTDTVFYDAQSVGGDTDPYDDVLLYADRNGLISMLGNPACQTVW